MKPLRFTMSPFLFVVLIIFSSSWATTSADTHEDFLHCLSSLHPEDSSSISSIIYTQRNSSYSSVLEASIRAVAREVYYEIAEKSRNLTFPGDNVIDAQFVDVNGRILDRKSMEEDLFWAIRGGGGGNFRIVLSWKINLVPVPETRFPELGLVEEDCTETSWVESLLLWNPAPNQTLDILLDRYFRGSSTAPAFKSKSDYVKKPIPDIAFKGIWSKLLEEDGRSGILSLVAHGGKMDEIPENALPHPHRRGYLYKINYLIGWQEEDNANAQRYITWIR
ncbi:hypothetical protein PTKIN_Ptkin09bG0243400 [Pterospermum kingtungense]